MGQFNIVLYDTREGEVGRVNGVPAESEREACEKVALKKGWLFANNGASYYAIDPVYFQDWNPKLRSKSYDTELARCIELVSSGQCEFRGLYQLYQYDGCEEEFQDKE